MAPGVVTLFDLDWVVELLAERRDALLEHAPIFWRPAPDAATASRDFLEYLLTDGGARAYCTSDAVLIAAPRGDGWLVDDLHVPGEDWASGDGRDLWNALAHDVGGDEVRFVCPAYEVQRARFAVAAGLTLAESWWLRELDTEGGEPGMQVHLPGVEAVTVPAPPVYAPPGPILFLADLPSAPSETVTAAVGKAAELGCAGVVVNVRVQTTDLTNLLRDNGFRHHCDYFTGRIEVLHGREP